MIKKFINYLFNFGLDETTYNKVKSKISKNNALLLMITLGIGGMIMLTIVLLSLFVSHTTSSPTAYFMVGLIIIVLFSISILFYKKDVYDFHIKSLIHITITALYSYGIVSGVFNSKNQLAVSFIVFIIFIPVIFIEKPIRIMAINIFFMILFTILSIYYKPANILHVDLIHVYTYGLIGILANMVLTFIKIQIYLLEDKLNRLSREDLLTGVKNRNAFEMDLDILVENCSTSLGCVYIDVNGLHELNNNKGHNEGDKMLKFIAQELVDEFFGDDVYRVGGDEFIVMVSNRNEIAIRQKMDAVNMRIVKAGYRIATGITVQDKEKLNIHDLVKKAEYDMRKAKEEYYKAHDRRSSGRR